MEIVGKGWGKGGTITPSNSIISICSSPFFLIPFIQTLEPVLEVCLDPV